MFMLLNGIIPLPPPPEGLHPLVVHIPIGLLLVVPVLILCGLLVKKCNMAWWIAAMVILLLGTVFAWVAVKTGGMSIKGEVVALATATNPSSAEAINALVKLHAETAKEVCNIFTALTVIFGVFLGILVMRTVELKKLMLWAIAAVFMMLWAFGAVKLAQAGHMGATLVHKYQVTVPVEATPPANP